MWEFLRDPVWQFAGAVFGLVAIVISIGLYSAQRQRKEFSYRVIANTQLLNVSTEIKPRLQILLDGKPVEDIRLILVKLGNWGNTPIVPEDFYVPITLRFGDQAQIISVEVTGTQPPGLSPITRLEATQVLLEPMLFNPEDSITLKLLVNQYSGSLTVLGRIIGVKEITNYFRSRSIGHIARLAFSLLYSKNFGPVSGLWGGVSVVAAVAIVQDWESLWRWFLFTIAGFLVFYLVLFFAGISVYYFDNREDPRN